MERIWRMTSESVTLLRLDTSEARAPSAGSMSTRVEPVVSARERGASALDWIGRQLERRTTKVWMRMSTHNPGLPIYNKLN